MSDSPLTRRKSQNFEGPVRRALSLLEHAGVAVRARSPFFPLVTPATHAPGGEMGDDDGVAPFRAVGMEVMKDAPEPRIRDRIRAEVAMP